MCEAIPRELEQSTFVGLITFNEQAFQKAQLDHHNYWNWRKLRNAARWHQQEAGELDYDAKNLMHCLRLLYSAQHVLNHREPLVRVSGAIREQLLAVRSGAFTYTQLIEQAQNLTAACEDGLRQADLPEQPAMSVAEELLWKIDTAL